MKIYLSGAITNDKDFKAKFLYAERELIKLGHEVINPAKLCDIMPKSTTHSEYMSLCYPLIDMCDIVVVLPNWESSVGANLEVQYAKTIYPISYFFDYNFNPNVCEKSYNPCNECKYSGYMCVNCINKPYYGGK